MKPAFATTVPSLKEQLVWAALPVCLYISLSFFLPLFCFLLFLSIHFSPSIFFLFLALYFSLCLFFLAAFLCVFARSPGHPSYWLPRRTNGRRGRAYSAHMVGQRSGRLKRGARESAPAELLRCWVTAPALSTNEREERKKKKRFKVRERYTNTKKHEIEIGKRERASEAMHGIVCQGVGKESEGEKERKEEGNATGSSASSLLAPIV